MHTKIHKDSLAKTPDQNGTYDSAFRTIFDNTPPKISPIEILLGIRMPPSVRAGLILNLLRIQPKNMPRAKTHMLKCVD